ncbi:MAG: DeoR/GlpR transcriptional regulator [Oscillospiraceae bacterium]|nr:DeoR/GlpR transcriptional regulator [Oscillospiraceae bacterium]
MLKIERQNLVDQELRKAGYVLVPELSRMLNCSEETVRRDLREMEMAGKLVRTHGGAYLVEKYDKGYPIELRKSYLPHTKERMAAVAVREIQENDMVMLDSSTTCLAIAEAILAVDLNVTLITNSLAICDLFKETNSNVNLIGIGGVFRRRTSSFADPNTVEALRHYYADKAFISCPKLSVEQGLSDNHISEATVRQQMLRSAEKKILVVDHTKFEGTANHLFDGLENVNVIITDQPLPEDFAAYAAKRKMQVLYSQD